MAWEKPTEEMLEVFAKAIPRHPPIDKKKMFGCPVGFLIGNMFLGLHQNRIVLRLSEEDRENFIKSSRATIFEPMPGRQMKEYVVVPETMNNSVLMKAQKHISVDEPDWTSEHFLFVY